MNPCTCNLPNLQAVCAQRCPNTVVKIALHLRLTEHSSHFGERGGGARTTGRNRKGFHSKSAQSPEDAKRFGWGKEQGLRSGGLWVRGLLWGCRCTTAKKRVWDKSGKNRRGCYSDPFKDTEPLIPLPFGSRTQLSLKLAFSPCTHWKCCRRRLLPISCFLVHHFQKKRQSMLLYLRNTPSLVLTKMKFPS